MFQDFWKCDSRKCKKKNSLISFGELLFVPTLSLYLSLVLSNRVKLMAEIKLVTFPGLNSAAL